MTQAKIISDKEFEAVTALAASQRYEYFVKHVADWQQVWSLRADNGWILARDNAGHELVPVWPHARYAAACATGNWQNHLPHAIALSAWMDAWLPGIERDERRIAVFLTPSDAGIAVTSAQLRADLEAELLNYE